MLFRTDIAFFLFPDFFLNSAQKHKEMQIKHLIFY
ncbi:Uncharacterised protein [Bacteroides heparinolyticus]|uniref:Uncharacterized protein n=1 Tax=Prevotella heparinolytica TaxID=28113 RepID=A0A449I500_9BACE|nr:Uncharacterised protein [Bacteroides heparinolyticus]